jgi:hypothetical protein
MGEYALFSIGEQYKTSNFVKIICKFYNGPSEFLIDPFFFLSGRQLVLDMGCFPIFSFLYPICTSPSRTIQNLLCPIPFSYFLFPFFQFFLVLVVAGVAFGVSVF